MSLARPFGPGEEGSVNVARHAGVFGLRGELRIGRHAVLGVLVGGRS